MDENPTIERILTVADRLNSLDAFLDPTHRDHARARRAVMRSFHLLDSYFERSAKRAAVRFGEAVL